MSIQQAISRIRSFASENDLSKRKLAEKAGIQDTTLRNFDQPDWNPTRATLEKLESIIPPDFTPKPTPSSEAAA